MSFFCENPKCRLHFEMKYPQSVVQGHQFHQIKELETGYESIMEMLPFSILPVPDDVSKEIIPLFKGVLEQDKITIATGSQTLKVTYHQKSVDRKRVAFDYKSGGVVVVVGGIFCSHCAAAMEVLGAKVSAVDLK